VDTVCIPKLYRHVAARALAHRLQSHAVWDEPSIACGLLPLWLVLFCTIMGLLMVSCQPMRPPSPQPSAPMEPRLLPTLQVPHTPPGTGPTASRAEQQAAFTAAEALRTSNQPLQARQAFANFVRRYPDSDLTDDALLALGHVSATLEQYAQAVPYYRSLLERFPRSERVPEAHLGLGVALYHRQDYANSLVELR